MLKIQKEDVLIRFERGKLTITGVVSRKEVLCAIETLGNIANSIYIDINGFSEQDFANAELTDNITDFIIGGHNHISTHDKSNVVKLTDYRRN